MISFFLKACVKKQPGSRFFFLYICFFIDDIDWWPIKEARTETFSISLRSLRYFVYFQDTKVIGDWQPQVNQCPE